MARQPTTPQSLKSIIGVALIGLGLNGAACPVSHLLSAIVGKVMGILPGSSTPLGFSVPVGIILGAHR